MALTFDTENLVIESTASITDLPAFHAELRDWEDSEEGVIWPVTHTWKALDLGGGAYMYQADLTNGWSLKFPTAGNYTINGNLNGTINPVAGVYVERKTSLAYATTAIGGSGPSAADIAAAILSAAQATPIHSNAVTGDYTAVQNAIIAALPSEPPTSAANATAVRAELAVELGRIDAAVSSRATPADVPSATNNATATKSMLSSGPLIPVDVMAANGSPVAGTGASDDKIRFVPP